MKYFGYIDNIEDLKEQPRNLVLPEENLDVASELDKHLFTKDQLTGNPVSLMSIVNSDVLLRGAVFARYGLDGSGTGIQGIDDAQFALDCEKMSEETFDTYQKRLKKLVQSQIDKKHG